MRLLFTTAFTFIISLHFAQNWFGFNQSGYAGIHANSFNVASSADTPIKWDINVVGLRISMFNKNIIPATDAFNDVQNGQYKSLKDLLVGDQKNLSVIGALNLPSVMYAIDEKSTISFNWDVRAFGLMNISSLDILTLLNPNFSYEDLNSKNYNSQYVRAIVNSWVEYELSYARVLYKDDMHKVKGGLGIKLLQGSLWGYAEMDQVAFTVNDKSLENFSMGFDYGYNDAFKNISEGQKTTFFTNSSVGMDLGFTYSYTPVNRKKPFYTFGFAARDLGAVKHEKAEDTKSKKINISDLDMDKFKGVQTLDELADSLRSAFKMENTDTKYVMVSLPHVLSFQNDFHIWKNVYANFTYEHTFITLNRETNSKLNFNTFYLTPRFDTKNWTFFMQAYYNSLFGTNSLGLNIGARFKYLIIGFSNLAGAFNETGNSKPSSAYFVLKIPIMKKN